MGFPVTSHDSRLLDLFPRPIQSGGTAFPFCLIPLNMVHCASKRELTILKKCEAISHVHERYFPGFALWRGRGTKKTDSPPQVQKERMDPFRDRPAAGCGHSCHGNLLHRHALVQGEGPLPGLLDQADTTVDPLCRCRCRCIPHLLAELAQGAQVSHQGPGFLPLRRGGRNAAASFGSSGNDHCRGVGRDERAGDTLGMDDGPSVLQQDPLREKRPPFRQGHRLLCLRDALPGNAPGMASQHADHDPDGSGPDNLSGGLPKDARGEPHLPAIPCEDPPLDPGRRDGPGLGSGNVAGALQHTPFR